MNIIKIPRNYKNSYKNSYKNRIRFSLIFALLVWSSHSVMATPAGGVVDDNSTSANATDVGAEVYDRACTLCHDSGMPKAPSKGMLGFMSTSAIFHALTEGVMAPRVSHVSRAEKQAVAEYLTGRSLDLAAEQAAFLLCEGPAAEFDINQPPKATGWGVTPDNKNVYSSAITRIDAENISGLTLKWAFGFPDAVRARSQPVVAGGAVIVGSQDGRVFSLDKETGCVRWVYRARAEVRTAIIMSPWKAGDDSASPAVFFGDYLGNVYSVDARSGKLRWQVRPDDHSNATITGSPTLYKNRLYVPVSSLEVVSAADPNYGCCTFRGSVVALDAQSGDRLWKTYTIAEKPVAQGKNTQGVTVYGASGAPVWNSPTIDSARQQLLVGTGENYSSPASATSDSILAMDLESGVINWVFQATKGDAWNASCEVKNSANCPKEKGPDYDFGAATILATASDGRDYVLAGQKSGVVWALDPKNGRLRWSKQVSKGGLNGGVHFGMAATGDTLFVPISDAQTSLNHAARIPNPGVFALDIKTGEYVWKWQAVTDICGDRKYCMPGNGAAISATAELVFVGSLDGYIRVHDVATGKVVWQFDTAREFATVNGEIAKGGAIEGGATAVLDGGMMFLNSGYFFNPYMPGNLFLAFELK